MERSFHSPLASSFKTFSPKSRHNVSGKRSVAPQAFRKSSRFSVSGKSTQSMQIVLKSPYNCIERFGQPLPVLVTEALTFADRNSVISARFSETGYAWVVCGRRLLIWQFKQHVTGHSGTPKRQTAGQCYELQLPQSDLAHKAELVSVFLVASAHSPSCIAVSPEGVVRYWPSVAHEGVSVETIVDLHGQECDSLTDIGTLGSILATTTCSVVHVQPQVTAGRHSLNCHALRAPVGWLGGISKRMSSLFFGPISSEHSQETKLVRVLTVEEHPNVWTVYVLAGHSLQKWRILPGQSEQLVFVAELNRMIRENFHSTVYEHGGGVQSETVTWLLDLQVDKENVIILVASVNLSFSPEVYYAMVALQTNGDQPPTHIRDFYLLKLMGLFREENPMDSLSYRFLISSPNAYLYNQKNIVVIKPQEEPDTLEFTGAHDYLLYGSICVNSPVFFSRIHGLVAVNSNEFGPELNASVASLSLEVSVPEAGGNNLSMYNMEPAEMITARKDTVGQLKSAFIFHIKNQHSACREILEEIFYGVDSPEATVNAVLDVDVIQICEDLLNDIPAGDPRWNLENRAGIGSSYAMQVLHQLEDKQRAHIIFLKFLQEAELWGRLGAITMRDTTLATVHVLAECYEKLVAAIVLKNVGSNPVLRDALDKVVTDEEIPADSGLTKQDIFFREVLKVHRVLQEMVEICENAVHSDREPKEVSVLISETNEIILAVLREVANYRKQNMGNFTPSPKVLKLGIDYLPWTAAAGREGLNDSLLLQQSLTCSHGARTAESLILKNVLYDQFVSLVDFILDGRKNHLESVKGTSREAILFKQYQYDRRKLISSLVEDQEWERAAILSEKYLDFETLVILCERTNNQERLDNYMDRFTNEGFSEYVYGWYLQENQPGKLINRCRMTSKPQNAQKLATFLAGHPSLSWLQNIFDRKFGSAADILRHLAENETELVTRQKTMYSFSKLAKLASPDTGDVDQYVRLIDSRLELISFQEDIPDYVLQHYGYNTEKLQVISPKDLIHLYTCTEYKEASEVEFKKALDIAEYVTDIEQREELTLQTWRRAILRDSWIDGRLDSPIEILQNTLFFRLVDLAIALGGDPHNLLPELDTLIDCNELENLQQSKNFQYLMKTGYEHVHKTFAADF